MTHRIWRLICRAAGHRPVRVITGARPYAVTIFAEAEALATRINKRMHGCIQIVLAEAYNKGKRGKLDKIRP